MKTLAIESNVFNSQPTFALGTELPSNQRSAGVDAVTLSLPPKPFVLNPFDSNLMLTSLVGKAPFSRFSTRHTSRSKATRPLLLLPIADYRYARLLW
jgi:hypothetical protein